MIAATRTRIPHLTRSYPILLPHRRFSSTLTSSSHESPAYPGLYYHPISSISPPSYSLSFLPTPPPSLSFSPTTIGLVSTAKSSTSDESGSDVPKVTPRNFQENAEFVKLLHEILREVIKGNEVLDTMAKTRPEDGWIHIADSRAPADPNRVPDPSDIIASVLCQSGQLIAESYEPSGTHRLVTLDGMMKLEPSLMKSLRDKLKVVRGVEEEIAKEKQVDGGE